MSGNSYVGGVRGYNKGGIVIGCHNSGRVTGNSSNTDGVCGKNEGTLENSSNNSGVCGQNDGGTVQNSYNTGDVSGSSDFGDVCGKNNRTVSNCYYLSATSGTDSNDPNAKTKEQFVSGEVAYLLQKALDDAASSGQNCPAGLGAEDQHGQKPCA